MAILVVIRAPSGSDRSTGRTNTGDTPHSVPSGAGSGDRSGSGTASYGGTTRSGHTAAKEAAGIPATESGLLPWQLAQPLSREVAVPGTGPGSVVVIGGLSSGSQTTAAVQSIQVPAGTPAPAGALSTATHDAAAAVVGGRVLVFGGGALTTVATVQAYPLGTAGDRASATVVGQLPQPRSDATAVTVGATAYVVGGYDGTRADSQVLATTNGSTFRTVGTLSVPVRYPAVAALGRMIYVFGGERVGTVAGAVDDIQRIDTQTGQISVIGHLPQAVSGASAVPLQGVVYVAGGTTGASDVATIYAFDARTAHALVAGKLMAPVANAAIAGSREHGLAHGRGKQQHTHRKRADAPTERQVRNGRRARRRVALFRGETPHR